MLTDLSTKRVNSYDINERMIELKKKAVRKFLWIQNLRLW